MQQTRTIRPPTPQYWGTSEPRLLQSPPALGDLGGQPLLQRLFDLVYGDRFAIALSHPTAQQPIRCDATTPMDRAPDPGRR
jgi:hypothetical protein